LSIFHELKRRNVFKVAAAYVIVGWLIMQAGEVMGPALRLPDWINSALAFFLILGFPLAMFFAWAFELTPDGIKKDKGVDQDQPIANETGVILNRTIIIALVLALAYFSFDKFILDPKRDAELLQTEAAQTEDITDPVVEDKAPDSKSIAVLPFVDLSQQADQEWFADGLAEEILNALVRVPDLLVASRTSSFRYRDSAQSAQEIGRELGVAHVLEGSVRSSAERIRVTAQLIRANDGFHVWSQNYDRETAEIIGIQEDLARKIAAVLQTSLDAEALAHMLRVGTHSVPAYQEYLIGLKGSQERGSSTRAREEVKDAYAHFERARSIDPTFFSAHIEAAKFWQTQLSINLTVAGLTTFSPLEILTRYHERISAARQNSRSEADRLLVMASQAEVDLRLNEALDLYEKYLQERPNDDNVRYSAIYTSVRANQVARGRNLIEPWLKRGTDDYNAASSFASSGYLVMEPNEAADYSMRALRNWPDDLNLLYQTHRTLLWAGRNREASELAARYRVISRDSTSPLLEMREACASGNRDAAERILLGIDPDMPNFVSNFWLMNNLLGNEQAVIGHLRLLETDGVPYQLAALLAYKQFDPKPFPSIMAVLEREGIVRPPPDLPPFACP